MQPEIDRWLSAVHAAAFTAVVATGVSALEGLHQARIAAATARRDLLLADRLAAEQRAIFAARWPDNTRET